MRRSSQSLLYMRWEVQLLEGEGWEVNVHIILGVVETKVDHFFFVVGGGFVVYSFLDLDTV